MLEALCADIAQIHDHANSRSILKFLKARKCAAHLLETELQSDVMQCSPLDNLATALTEFPGRITHKWKFEFARLCDLSRMLALAPLSHSVNEMRYSPIVKQFGESCRLTMSQSTFMFVFSGAGNDPDERKLTNLIGPNESTVRQSVSKTQEHHVQGW